MRKPIALVTGAGKRIGRDIAIALAKADYAVAVHHHASGGEAEDLVRALAKDGGEAMAFGRDLQDWGAAAALVDAVKAGIGAPTLLVNCAAVFHADAVESFDQATWRRQFAVNLEAPLLLAQAFAKSLPDGAQGSIVNIVDQRVQRLTPQNFSYTLTKSALWTATQTMAQALAPRIRVNAVGPGPTYPSWRQGEDGLLAEADNILLRRMVSGAEIAEAVLYLARARSVTGTMLCVDGGQLLAWRTPDIVD